MPCSRRVEEASCKRESVRAGRVSSTLPALLRQFALELDFDKSLAVLSILLVA